MASTKQPLLLRYIVLVALSLEYFLHQESSLLYKIFTWPTVHTSSFVLGLFYPSTVLANNTLSINAINIAIIPACIGGAAYFLLICLNLATPMRIKKRFYLLAFSILALFFSNVIRIILFSILALNNIDLFNATHMLVWYFGSTILVIVIWLISTKIFKIKTIPAYTDLALLKKEITLA